MCKITLDSKRHMWGKEGGKYKNLKEGEKVSGKCKEPENGGGPH